jgi:antitoxin component HigA of HigAB toxin-antitoxin module
MDGATMPKMTTTKPSSQTLPADFMAMVKLHPLMAVNDDVGYENAMEYIDALTSIPRPSKGQADYLEALSVLVGAYADEHWEIRKLKPHVLLKALVNERAMSASALGRVLGERTLGPKLVSGERELSKAHIRKLSDFFGVRADLFL